MPLSVLEIYNLEESIEAVWEKQVFILPREETLCWKFGRGRNLSIFLGLMDHRDKQTQHKYHLI